MKEFLYFIIGLDKNIYQKKERDTNPSEFYEASNKLLYSKAFGFLAFYQESGIIKFYMKEFVPEEKANYRGYTIWDMEDLSSFNFLTSGVKTTIKSLLKITFPIPEKNLKLKECANKCLLALSVSTLSSSFILDQLEANNYEEGTFSLSTRTHGDVGDGEYSNLDYSNASAARKAFMKYDFIESVDIEVVDEWVMLNIKIK